MTTAKPSVFISYSHKDRRLMEQLATHLQGYEWENLLTVWDDRRIRVGQDWLPEIEQAIQEAQVAVFLVSSNFLASKFIRGQEVPPILERRRRDGLHVVPVILKACNWQDVPVLSGIEARPKDQTVYGLQGDRREKALAAIAKEIKELLQMPASARPASPPAVLPSPAEIRSAVHQLPAPPLDFTGRATELEILKAAVREGKTTAIFGVRGMGGVGKTALALKLAHEIAPLYPDGQIFLDLLGVTTPVSAAEAMAHVTRSFQPDARLPAFETDLAPLYRSVLHGKRVLLLMDNAAGKEQVEPLLPPEGSSLLVTSRIRFTLPGLVGRDLDELPREESRELLLKICPRVGEHAEDLARVCGDLPLALRVAASTLQERRALSTLSYLERLTSGRERLEPVEKALDLSCELLSEQLRLRWYQLAVFPESFYDIAAAAVWKVETEAAEPILAELERNSLLEWEEASKRYRLHDLVRAFVERRLEETERWSARERHARHYLLILAVAEHLYMKGAEDLGRGLKLFDLEWRNIQAGHAFAAAEATQGDTGAQLCSNYPDQGVFCLLLRLPPGERIHWRETALAAAQYLGHRAAEGRHLGELGTAYRELGDFRQAIDFTEQALAISREVGDLLAEGVSLGCLGDIYIYLEQPSRALEYYKQQLATTRESGDRRGEGNALGGLGNAYSLLDAPRRAIEFYEQSLAVTRESGNLWAEKITFWNLGELYEEEDPARAVELMQVYVDFCRETGHFKAEFYATRMEAIRARIKL